MEKITFLIFSFNVKKMTVSHKAFLQRATLTFLFGLLSLPLLHVQFAEQPALLLQDLIIDQRAGGRLRLPQH